MLQHASRPQDIADNCASGDGDAGAWASDDQWMLLIALGAQHKDVFRAMSSRERIVLVYLAQPGAQEAVGIYLAYIAEDMASCPRCGESVA